MKLPIKGLVAKRGEHYVRYNGDDDATPFDLYRDNTWIGSYQTRKRAVDEMDRRIEVGAYDPFAA